MTLATARVLAYLVKKKTDSTLAPFYPKHTHTQAPFDGASIYMTGRV
jgi:hypothetical protein